MFIKKTYLKEYFYFVYRFKLHLVFPISDTERYVVARRQGSRGKLRSDFHQRVRDAWFRDEMVLYWNWCRRSIFHISSPLISEKWAGRWHCKVIQSFPVTSVTRWLAIVGALHCQVQLVYISSFNLLSCDHYVHCSLKTWTAVYCWHFGINCPRTWNKTNSVFLVVLTVPSVILYVIQRERKQFR